MKKIYKYKKILIPTTSIFILFIVIIISAFYLNKKQGYYAPRTSPVKSIPSNSTTNSIPVKEIDYGPATTTITLPTDGYSTKIYPLPPIRSDEQLLKESKDFGDDGTYHYFYAGDIKEFGDVARRFIDESLGIAKVRKFDVDMDGKDETIITLCGYTTNGCPHKFIIMKDNKVIFSVDQGGRHLNLVRSETGNGFTVHWAPIVGTEEEMERSYCCPTAHMETTFIYKNGTFKPVFELKL